jgi:hypothetical protein
MQPMLIDPAVAAVEAALLKTEGPFNVLSHYYTNPDEADRRRFDTAVELTRIVDRTRLGVALVRLMDRDGRAVDDDGTTPGALTT